jgi:hypothetical protein
VLENRQNPVEYVLIVPPIAFGGIVGMKAPAIWYSHRVHQDRHGAQVQY